MDPREEGDGYDASSGRKTHTQHLEEEKAISLHSGIHVSDSRTARSRKAHGRSGVCLSRHVFLRLGEFTAQTLESFNPTTHVTTQHLSYDHLHLPRTKVAGNEGEDVYWASQDGDTDPTAALMQHLRVNQPSATSHLFAYKATNTRRPLTKKKFLERVGVAARAAGLEPLQGHGILIGSTLEYLLRGVPFDVMKAKRCGAGDSFQLYLRKHAVIIAPYIQAAPVHEEFIRYTMPPVR